MFIYYHFCIVNCQAWGHIPYSGQIQKTTGSKETLSQSQVPRSGRLCQQTIGCRNHFLDKSNISRIAAQMDGQTMLNTRVALQLKN